MFLEGNFLFWPSVRRIGPKKSIVDNHIKSSKIHSAGKKLAEKGRQEKDIAKALKAYNKSIWLGKSSHQHSKYTVLKS